MFIEIASAAVAAGEIGIEGSKAYELDDIIRVAIALVVLFSGMLAVFYFIWGGVMLILSGGKEEKTKPAINSIRYSIIGLIIIILAIFISPKIGDMLGLNVSKYVSPNAIFLEIKQISTKFFGSKDDLNIDSSTGTDELPADFSNL
ncbi:MAG: hypothetical protein PHZ26_04830 [Candidatus Gracilibacteria bacterium]|nr:hypothetical protein [Candidatus Gracilibacteria bacterium]MDD2909053.1 hypothetical protein [Candidatus Gracilibacteria bacterium]